MPLDCSSFARTVDGFDWRTKLQVAFAIIEEELGQPLEQIFSKISSQTIAAASLGQVYRATLRETGEDVAIKVHRPST